MTNADLTVKFIQEESPIIVPVAFGVQDETTVLIQLTPSEDEEDTVVIEVTVGGAPASPTTEEVAGLGYLLNTLGGNVVDNAEFLAANQKTIEVPNGDS